MIMKQKIEEAKILFKAGYESLLVSSGQGVNNTSSIPGARYLTNKQQNEIIQSVHNTRR